MSEILRSVSVITHTAAQRAVEVALAHASDNRWKVAAAVCDTFGALIAFGRLDGTPVTPFRGG
jgi:glc operon protein GlcG